MASGTGAAAECFQALSEDELFQVENWLEEEPPAEGQTATVTATEERLDVIVTGPEGEQVTAFSGERDG